MNLIDLFPPIYIASPSPKVGPWPDDSAHADTLRYLAREIEKELSIPKKRKIGQVQNGGRWWEDKTPEERAEIIKRRTASRHANVATFPPEARPKSAWGTVGAGLSKKTRNAKHQARLQIKNLQAHGITPSPELFQRAMDGVTPAQKQRIPNAQRKPSAP